MVKQNKADLEKVVSNEKKDNKYLTEDGEFSDYAYDLFKYIMELIATDYLDELRKKQHNEQQIREVIKDITTDWDDTEKQFLSEPKSIEHIREILFELDRADEDYDNAEGDMVEAEHRREYLLTGRL